MECTDRTAPPTDRHLRPTDFIDSEHPTVQAFVREHQGVGSETERAARLFLAVRDQVRYDPYSISNDPATFKASAVLERRAAFCVPKAIALCACYRAAGLPARLGFADVTNHLSTQRLRELLGTDVFAFHGYTSLWLSGRWFKVTPAFNAALCAKFGVAPLEFDGHGDAVLQPFNRDGARFMEYRRDRGEWDDFPFDEMMRVFKETYPQLAALYDESGPLQGDFAAEAARER